MKLLSNMDELTVPAMPFITREQILEKMPKMSDALERMMTGLIKFASTPKHAIEMGTYGTHENGVCYGCAATSCVLDAFPDLPIDEDERHGTGMTFQRGIYTFESCINDARNGLLRSLCDYYGVDYTMDISKEILDILEHVEMDNVDWHHHLPAMCKVVQLLREAGL